MCTVCSSELVYLQLEFTTPLPRVLLALLQFLDLVD